MENLAKSSHATLPQNRVYVKFLKCDRYPRKAQEFFFENVIPVANNASTASGSVA